MNDSSFYFPVVSHRTPNKCLVNKKSLSESDCRNLKAHHSEPKLDTPAGRTVHMGQGVPEKKNHGFPEFPAPYASLGPGKNQLWSHPARSQEGRRHKESSVYRLNGACHHLV